MKSMSRLVVTTGPEEQAGKTKADNHSSEQTHSRGGHFIRQDPAGFDAPFFGITAKEAASSE